MKQKYSNELQEEDSHHSIKVAVRVRPLTQKQQANNKYETVECLNSKRLDLYEPDNQQHQTKKSKPRQTQFAFDYVYDKNISTKKIFDSSIHTLLDSIFQGYNSTILAYGATGCGKTYTMIGQSNKEGVIPLAMIDLLSRCSIQRRYRQIYLKMSYLEIYNQNIKDLLISDDKNFDIREDPKEGVIIPGITQIMVNSILELNTLLKVGNKNRSKQATGANQASSRSHAILQVKIQSQQKVSQAEVNYSRLSLVDLAGSQRAQNTTNKGMRMVEGAKINKSLLTLGNCIQVLSDINDKTSKNNFVPFRDSKLTRILKQSLGGNCRTMMVVNISPYTNSYEETYNTLLYATRAMNIKNNATKNIVSDIKNMNYSVVLTNLRQQNDELKKQLKKQQAKSNSLPSLKNNNGYNAEVERIQALVNSHFRGEETFIDASHEKQMKIQKLAFELFKMEIEHQNDYENVSDYAKKKQLIEYHTENRRLIQAKMEKKTLQRGDLVKEIKGNNVVGQIGVPYLMAHYKQKKAETQYRIIQNKEKILQFEKREKEMLRKLFKKQLKKRDRIIQQQKIILKKNNIINRITYRKLNTVEQDNSVNFDVNQSFDDLLKKKSINSYRPIKQVKNVDEGSPIKRNVKILGKHQKIKRNQSTKLTNKKAKEEQLFNQFDVRQNLKYLNSKNKNSIDSSKVEKKQEIVKKNNLIKTDKKVIKSKNKQLNLFILQK